MTIPSSGQDGVRGEIWAYGFRNPWKMAFDPVSDTLWTGDVGWEMMEMVYRVDRGANYGWSVMEGSQVVKENGRRTVHSDHAADCRAHTPRGSLDHRWILLVLRSTA